MEHADFEEEYEEMNNKAEAYRELVEKISYKIQDDREQIKRGLEYMPSEVDNPDDIAKYFIDLVSEELA